MTGINPYVDVPVQYCHMLGKVEKGSTWKSLSWGNIGDQEGALKAVRKACVAFFVAAAIFALLATIWWWPAGMAAGHVVQPPLLYIYMFFPAILATGYAFGAVSLLLFKSRSAALLLLVFSVAPFALSSIGLNVAYREHDFTGPLASDNSLVFSMVFLAWGAFLMWRASRAVLATFRFRGNQYETKTSRATIAIFLMSILFLAGVLFLFIEWVLG